MKEVLRGFTLIELLVSVSILSILAMVTMPMVELTVQRHKEERLRQALYEIRQALDAYREAGDRGRITRNIGDSGYPPSLRTLVAGVIDRQSPELRRIYFLRRIPRDPMASDTSLPPESTWGLRSYLSPADDPRAGEDVYDVYSLSERIGLNRIPYSQW